MESHSHFGDVKLLNNLCLNVSDVASVLASHCGIPSHPIPSHPIPSLPIPSHPIPWHPSRLHESLRIQLLATRSSSNLAETAKLLLTVCKPVLKWMVGFCFLWFRSVYFMVPLFRRCCLSLFSFSLFPCSFLSFRLFFLAWNDWQTHSESIGSCSNLWK